MAGAAEWKQAVVERIDTLAGELVEISHSVHAHPELAFEEHFAAECLVRALRQEGLEVEAGAYGVDTAFAARVGDGDGPHVVVCCEYDALPDIGHACGHNVIAAAGLGAGLALAAVAEAAGGRVTILGTPAEEAGGGKIAMGERGAFADADAAMMIHPAGADFLAPTMLAMTQFDVRAHGQSAHAAGFPWRGVNALDAIVMGYVAVGQLRQHIHPSERVHGIITRGGAAPNVVPDLAAARFNVRARTGERLERLKGRVLACFEGAAPPRVMIPCTRSDGWMCWRSWPTATYPMT
ncbi:MAG TPA: amidohydrolase, partial [Acidimicrobiia bacterium]|nr:amidohydrolase [Acidimicrobiia bacterium]